MSKQNVTTIQVQSSSSSIDSNDDDIIEFINDQDWNRWLKEVVQLLGKYETQVETLEFLGQIKQKIEDCSRCYVAIWTIEMLYKSADKLKDKISSEFVRDVGKVKQSWDKIMQPIRSKRQELICQKCIEFFYEHFEGANDIVTSEKVNKWNSSFTDKWNKISKMCYEAGLNSDVKYQTFIGKLTNEMVKY
jgi:hypothetical protein